MTEYDFDDYDGMSPLLEKRNRLQLLFVTIGKAFLIFILPLVAVIIAIMSFLSGEDEKTGYLLVTSEPDSAIVILNGTAIVQPPGEIISGLPPGMITVAVHRQGYLSQPEEFLGEIVTKDTLKVHFTLQKNVIEKETVQIEPERIRFQEKNNVSKVPTQNSSTPDPRRDTRIESKKTLCNIIVTSNIKGAQIFLDGEDSGQTTNYTFRELEGGIYSLSVKKKGFICDPEFKIVTLEEYYQTEIAHFHLTAKRKEVVTELIIETIPVAGEIYIDDSPAGKGSYKSAFDPGSYKISFGPVKNYRTPNDRYIELSREYPVGMVSAEYVRIIGQSAVALGRIPRNGVIHGESFEFYLDGALYFNPDHGNRNVYLIDDLLTGEHIVKFSLEGITHTEMLECRDGYVIDMRFLIERVLNKRSIKILSKREVLRSDWMKDNAGLNVEIVLSPKY